MDERDLTGRVLGGKYRIDRALGRGGMGAVYASTELELGRRVAIKVMLPALARDHTALARFRREAEIAAGLGHPNIVQVSDFGTDPLGLFFVMDLLEGEPLSAVLRRERQLEPRRVLSIAVQILSALSAVHAQGVVHRDLKPPNVFLAAIAGLGEIVKILDFGVAKLSSPEHTRLTATGFAVGTVTYMAPEQLTGSAVDGRTDLYALGVIMYRCLTGRLPHEGSRELLPSMILSAPATPVRAYRPEVDPRLAAIVERALAKEPSARFTDAGAMADALTALEGAEPGPVAPPEEIPATRLRERIAHSGAPTAATRNERPVREAPAGTDRAGIPAWALVGGGAVAATVVAIGVVLILGLVVPRNERAGMQPIPGHARSFDAAVGTPLTAPALPDAAVDPVVVDATDPEPKDAAPASNRGRRIFERVGLGSKRRTTETQPEEPTGESMRSENEGSSSNGRRITIDSTDYVLVGDVRYRVVLADLLLSPYYSSWEDGPMLNRRRGRAIDCLIAAEWTPSAPRRSSCFTAQVDATGAISDVAPTEARFAGDATLDRCTRSMVASLDLGPTRSGTAGPIRVCVDAYLSR